MKQRSQYIVVSFIFFLFACAKQKQQQNSFNFKPPTVIEAKAYKVPKEKTAPPIVIPATGLKKVMAGKPEVIQLKSNVFPAITERVVLAGVPEVLMPPGRSVEPPTVVAAKDSPYIAGVPEIFLLKDLYIKENNPASFSTIKATHGLNSNEISSLCQDKAGNIWIGEWFGGISRYDGRFLTNYSIPQGLSSDIVNCILEDKNNNIWIGTTDAGVNKFDGRYITRYSTKEGLSNNFIHYMLQDKKGNIWFATDKGLNRYDGRSFIHYTTAQGLPSDSILTLFEDDKNTLWIGCRNGIAQFDGYSFRNYNQAFGLEFNSTVACITQDNEKNFWFTVNGQGLYKFDGAYISRVTAQEDLNSNSFLTIIKDNYGDIWIGTSDHGAYRYDGKSIFHLRAEEGLSNEIVPAILQDRYGNIWLGTTTGICKYDGRVFNHIMPAGLEEIECLMADKAGKIWAASGSSDCINMYDGRSIARYAATQGLFNTQITYMLQDRYDNIWFCSFDGVDKFDGRYFTHYAVSNGLPHNVVYCMLEDKEGNLWFGTRKGLSKFDGTSFTNYYIQQGLNSETIFTLFEDHRDNIWIGTSDKGVCSFDGKVFTHYDPEYSVSHPMVIGMMEDRHNNIWFCTNTGVNKFDGKTFTWYTTEQGLSNNIVKNLLEDRNGNIWVGTINGLNRLMSDSINTGRPSFKKYHVTEGFLGAGTYENSIVQNIDGTIWIGANDRLTSYHPEGDIADTIAPTIQLSGIALFEENINWIDIEKKKDSAFILNNGIKLKNFGFSSLTDWYNQPQNLELAYNNNYISFQFIGITTKRPKEVRYQYLLEGLDEHWSSLTDKPEATYNNLPHGKYTFKVKAVNSDGYWSNELAYSFIIHPSWWRTWWFESIAAICIVVLGYALMRWRIKQRFHLQLERSKNEKQLAELQRQKTELEMQALRAQMNPHFIFNSLNSINRFILQNNRAQASEYLTKFSKLVRLILQNSQASLITLESELESLKLYLELERLRFDDHFAFKIIIHEELDTDILKIPPLIIQPFAENAIWHGLMNKEEKGHLQIELFQQDEMLCCKITDDGIGRKKAETLNRQSTSIHKSMGLRITEERIAMLQQQKQVKSSVQITDLVLPDGTAAGTEVLLKIPLII